MNRETKHIYKTRIYEHIAAFGTGMFCFGVFTLYVVKILLFCINISLFINIHTYE
jgi:hypothetical protein